MEQISGFPKLHLKTRTIDSGFVENFAFSKEFWFALVIYIVSHRRISRKTCVILLGFGISLPHCFLLCRQDIIQPYLYVSSSNHLFNWTQIMMFRWTMGSVSCFFFLSGCNLITFSIKKHNTKQKLKKQSPWTQVFLFRDWGEESNGLINKLPLWVTSRLKYSPVGSLIQPWSSCKCFLASSVEYTPPWQSEG